jgi:hypothetical protein
MLSRRKPGLPRGPKTDRPTNSAGPSAITRAQKRPDMRGYGGFMHMPLDVLDAIWIYRGLLDLDPASLLSPWVLAWAHPGLSCPSRLGFYWAPALMLVDQAIIGRFQLSVGLTPKSWRDSWRDGSRSRSLAGCDSVNKAAEAFDIQESQMARPLRLERGTLCLFFLIPAEGEWPSERPHKCLIIKAWNGAPAATRTRDPLLRSANPCSVSSEILRFPRKVNTCVAVRSAAEGKSRKVVA